MREIKFRAYSKKYDTMCYEVQDEYDTLGEQIQTKKGIKQKENYILRQESFGSYLDEDNGFIVMQYTGLKDKNGKEIYEGDIVKELDKIFQVTFSKGCFYICNSIYSYKVSDFMGLEVIGNMYENPELLGDKDETKGV